MTTESKIIYELCDACGVDHGTGRVTDRRARELIGICTERVKQLTLGTAALATVLKTELDEDSAEKPLTEIHEQTTTAVEGTQEETTEQPVAKDKKKLSLKAE